MAEHNPQASGWFDTPLARRLLAQERLLLERVLPDVFGFYTLQIGTWGPGSRLGAEQLVGAARTQLKIVLTGQPQEGVGLSIRASAGRLPIASESVDALVLPHTLERVESPHGLLRECQRVLVPDGRLLVLGFNPWSMWCFRRLVTRRRFPIGARRFLTQRRLHDWLELLDLDVQQVLRYAFRPPVGGRRVQTRTRWMERVGPRAWPLLSGAYLLEARKRLAAMTPMHFKLGHEAAAAASAIGSVAR